MKTNLNIIKIFFLFFLVESALLAWNECDSCQDSGCLGCTFIKPFIESAANTIDSRHLMLEQDISDVYQNDILDTNIDIINTIQEKITKNIAHIRAMEYQADIDNKELNFLLRKNKELFTLFLGTNQ